MNEAETMAKMIDAKIKVYCWDVRDGSSILRWYNISDENDKVKKGLIDAVSDAVNDAVSDTVKSVLNLKEGATKSGKYFLTNYAFNKITEFKK